LSRVFVDFEGFENIREDFVVNLATFLVFCFILPEIPTAIPETYPDTRTRHDREEKMVYEVRGNVFWVFIV
jgi:hypothetical protein